MILIVCFIVLSLVLFTKYLLSKNAAKNVYKNILDIPSPGSLPIVGNIEDFFCNDEEIWKRREEKARNYYPIFRLEQFKKNTVFLIHPGDIEMILDNSNVSRKGPIYDTLRRWTGNGLIVSEGSFWQKRRKILTKSFHFAVLREYLKTFNKHIDFLIRTFKNEAQNQPVEVSSTIKHVTLKIINEVIAGEKSNVNEDQFVNYGKAVEQMTKIISYKSTRPYVSLYYNFLNLKKKEDEALEIIHEFSEKLLENYDYTSAANYSAKDRKLLDVMLNQGDIFDDEGIFDEVNTFTLGGHDTTSTALTFILLVLANYPEYQDDLYQEIIGNSAKDQPVFYGELSNMKFLDRFLKECLRLFPPVTFIGRELVKNIVTKTGYELPTGTAIIIDIYNLHRNPDVFPDPHTFNPDRFSLDNISKRHPFAYIPFSAGPRNCIAQKFATLELKTSICAILKKFIVEPGDRIEDIEFIPDTMLQTKNNIKVKFSLRT